MAAYLRVVPLTMNDLQDKREWPVPDPYSMTMLEEFRDEIEWIFDYYKEQEIDLEEVTGLVSASAVLGRCLFSRG